MKRFYPDHLPVVPNEPRWEDFCVLDVDDKRGQGVLVLRDFSQGSVLFRMNGTLKTEMTLHCCRWDQDSIWTILTLQERCSTVASQIRGSIPNRALTLQLGTSQQVSFSPWTMMKPRIFCFVRSLAVADLNAAGEQSVDGLPSSRSAEGEGVGILSLPTCLPSSTQP